MEAADPSHAAAETACGAEDREPVGAGSAVRSLTLLACAALVAAGCMTETNIYRDPTPHPGTSLHKQWEELVWSTESLLRMDDWWDSMKSDLADYTSLERGQLRETFELWGW